MDKRTVAAILNEMSILLELTGENPFKARAYSRAARAVSDLNEDLEKMAGDGRLTSVDGIGKSLADHISEIIRTGGLAEYDRLKASIPKGVIEMLAIPGLGPKKVRILWEDHGVGTIGELELMCKRGILEGVPGFGKKTEENILAGIKSFKSYADKWLLIDACAWAGQIHEEVKRWPEVIRSEVAGSIRRHKALVKDIDIVVATDKPEEVMGRFVSLPGCTRVVQHGATKSEIILPSGIQCDLRAVSDEEYPFALHHFTGSKEHNIRMRGLAKSKRIKMNEYGLFKGSSRKSIPCGDEAHIFGALGLEYIEPELREDMGEIEAAMGDGRLPNLVAPHDVRGVIHAHSVYTDGSSSIAEMAEAARAHGYEYLVMADHSQAVTIAGGMKEKDVKRQHREIDGLNRKLKGFRILKGIEVDILPDGKLDYDDGLLSSFDFVIAAIHSRFGMSEDEMTKRIIDGISSPCVDMLAHPTGRLLLAREPYKVNVKRVVDAAADLGKAIEINAHPQRLDLDWHWCKYAKEKGVKLAICPDAHSPDGINHIIFGVWVARKGWLERSDILNCLSADRLLKFRK